MQGIEELRAKYGWPAASPGLPFDDHGWFGWCPSCQARFEPVGTLSRNEAVVAIQHVHGFPSVGAAYKALQRAGAKGLAATWPRV